MVGLYNIIKVIVKEDLRTGINRPIKLYFEFRIASFQMAHNFIKFFGGTLEKVFKGKKFKIIGVIDFSDEIGETIFKGGQK